ncbi:MAG: hypothetical protein LBU73_03065 [Helicobacteraceae bacterium]|nr:hypothetical protein [Helicobacteraceae bacterium]
MGGELEEIALQDEPIFNYPLIAKIIASALAASLFLFAVFARDSGFDAAFRGVDERAEKYLEGTLAKTAVAYAAVRGIHAVVAIFRGTEVHPPFVTLALGEALDPVQDLIERVSDVLTLAIASLGAQRILMELGQMIGAAVFAAIGSLLILIGLWARAGREHFLLWGARLVVFGFAARLLIPFMAVGADIASENLLASRFEQANAQVESDKNQILSEPIAANEDAGFFEKLKSFTSVEVFKSRIENFKQKCENLAHSLVTLFTLFVFQTLVFPLISLFVLLKLCSALTPKFAS